MKMSNRIAIVVPTLGERSELFHLVNFCLDNKLLISIADQSTSGVQFPREITENTNLIIEHLSKKGASNGRNIAIKNLPPDVEFAFTLNDCSIPSLSFIEESIRLFDLFPEIYAIGGIYLYRNGGRANGKTGFLSGADISSVIEPGMIMRVHNLETAYLFNTRLGPGANSLLQSGEVTELLYRARRSGKKVLMLNRIASTDFRESPMHSILVDFKYGVSFGVVHNCNGNRRYVLLRTLSPLVRKFLGMPKGDSPVKLMNLIAICAGRLFSLLIPNCFAARVWDIR